MGVLDRFERRLDRLVNGAFARAFKSEVQPVEIASALQRECDDKAAIVGRGRTIVPNTFRVELGERDYQRLIGYAEPLSKELGDVVKEHAAEQGYVIVGPVTTKFERADDLETGMFRVISHAEQGPIPEDVSLPNARFEVGGKVIDPPSRCDSRRSWHLKPTYASTTPASRAATPSCGCRPTPTISDLGSTNGTIVDGANVEEASSRTVRR